MKEKIMSQVIEQALNNQEGGPFAAIITDKEGNIIATGHNKVTSSNDPTAHAEVDAIRNACKKLNTHQLDDCIIYSSCEPCPMCLSAIIWSNIKEVYYAATRHDAEKIGFRDSIIYDYLANKNNIIITKKIDLSNESEKTLLAIFILLAITVISLFIYYLTMDKPPEINNEIALPLINEEPISTSISISNLNTEDNEEIEYLFQVTNHSNDEVSKEVKDYNIEIINASNYNIEIQLQKLDNEEYKKINLSEQFISENISFNTKEKDNHNYKLIISSTETFEEFSFIGLSINPVID